MSMPQAVTAARPVIAASINRAHRNASEAEAVLRDLLNDLEGGYGDDACAPQPTGLIYEADNLADRIGNLIGLAERVRSHIAQSKVVPMNSAQGRAGTGIG